jgi:hypothetical protein
MKKSCSHFLSKQKTFLKRIQHPERVLSVFLLAFFLVIVSEYAFASTPNPGHPWTEVGDGLIQFNTPTALRTYTLPDQNATLLTTLPFSQGDILYGTGASTTATLPKDTNATRYLSNTGASNNPAWSTINLLNGVSGILPGTNGGTGNASTSFTGQTVARVYTLPDANTTLLSTSAAVTLAQGGTGANITASNGGIVYSNSSTFALLNGTSTSGRMLQSGTSTTPSWSYASYPATSSTFGNVISSDGTNFISYPLIPNVMNRTMTILANGGLTTATNLGFPAAPTLTATASNADDASGPWINQATSGVSGNSSGVISAAFTYFRSAWSPKFSAYIKTDPANITLVGYWVGMFSATPDNNATPAIHGAAFRYYTSADGTAFWRTVTMAGSVASTTVTTTSVAIAADTTYKMYIDCTASSTCAFYINGALVSTHTTFLPATSTTLGYGARVTTLTNAARNLKWSKVSITHD